MLDSLFNRWKPQRAQDPLETRLKSLNSPFTVIDPQIKVRSDQFEPEERPRYVPLSIAEKKALIQDYQDQTGFPDLEAVSKTIVDHTKALLEEAEQAIFKGDETEKILYAFYGKHSSVAEGRALPGSDFDGFTVVYRGSKDQGKALLKWIKQHVNPRFLLLEERFLKESINLVNVADIQSLLTESCPEPWTLYFQEKDQRLHIPFHVNFMSASEFFISSFFSEDENKKISEANWLERLNVLRKLLTGHKSSYEPFDERLNFGAFPDYCEKLEAIEGLRFQPLLMNHMDVATQGRFENSPIYKQSHWAEHYYDSVSEEMDERPKYALREAISKHWEELSLDEQFVLCALFESSQPLKEQTRPSKETNLKKPSLFQKEQADLTFGSS